MPEPVASSSKKRPATELAVRLAEVTAERDQAAAERDSYKRLYLEMLAQCRKLELGIIGRGRERDLGDPSQVTMSLLGLMTGGAANSSAAPASPATPPATHTIAQHQRAKPTGRKPLPEKLPRIDIEVLPPEVQARGLDAFEKIGEDVTETVERRRASLVVVRVTKPKLVAKDRDLKFETKVFQAASPELPPVSPKSCS